jgi:hypothetical protein
MNITEREDTRKYLEDLKKGPGNLTLDLWSDLVEEAIRTTLPVESPIHDRLKELRKRAQNNNDINPLLTAYPLYLSAAQFYLGRFQPDTRDESLERQVLSIIDAKFLETNIMKIAKWVGYVVIPAIIALVVGGTVYGTFQVRGALDTIERHFKESVQAVEAAKKEAVNSINQTLGDDKHGILHDLQKERKSAIDTIGTMLGAADKKDTVLGQIEDQKKRALSAIATALGNKSEGTGALGAIQTAQGNALSSLDKMVISVDKELRKQAPKRIESLAKQTLDIQSRLERLEPAADRILKAQAILTQTSGVITPKAVLSLLHWQLVVMFVVVGLFAGGAGALLVSWLG